MREMSEVSGAWTPVPDVILRDAQLSPQARCLYALLMSYARPSRGKMTVWPGIQELAQHYGGSERRLKEVMQELVDRGLVMRRRRMGQSTVTVLTEYQNVYSAPECPTSGAIVPDDGAPECPTEADVSEADEVTAPLPEEAGPHEVQVIPAEEYVPRREVIRREQASVLAALPQKVSAEKRSSRYRVGVQLANLWDSRASPQCSVPGVSSRAPGVLVSAAKTLEGLSHTPWRGKPPEEIMELVIARVKACNEKVRRCINFEFLFVSKALNLEKLLNGNWDDKPDEDPMERRARKAEGR